MTEEDPKGTIELADAIEALRDALVKAWWDGRNKRVRFRIEPVELTVHVGATQAGKGAVGIKWHVLGLGAERSHESANTQTLKLRLAPLIFDNEGNIAAQTEQFITDRDSETNPPVNDSPTQEPA